MPTTDLLHLGLATALGLLVGLQREWADQHPAGRTFTLLTMFGALCGLLSQTMGGMVVLGGFVSLAALTIAIRSGSAERVGFTSLVAGLVMFCVGLLCTSGHAGSAVVMTGIVALLLHWKKPLKKLIEATSHADVQGVVQLVLVGMVILPVLPNIPMGPYGVLNPFRVWLMVVLIVGISLAAWLAQRLFGRRSGTVVAGILGGLISSTATTIAVSRQCRESADRRAAGVIVLLASTIVFARVLFEVALVARSTLPDIGPPLFALLGWMGLLAIIALVVLCRHKPSTDLSHSPSSIRGAVVFGVLYAGVLLSVAAGRAYLGDSGLYAVAALSGLTDMDAITLATSQMVDQGDLSATSGGRLILTGAISNIMFKTILAGCLGGRRLLGLLLPFMLAGIAGGAALIIWWPAW